MMFLRSLIFSVGWLVSTVFFGATTMFTIVLPFRYRYAYVGQFARFNLWMLKVVCGLRYRVCGREHLSAGPAIIFCKHQSIWETLVLQRLFPPLVWVLKRELLWLPFFGWGLAAMRPIAINRGAGRRAITQVVDQGCARLKDGQWVVIFPEGTRVPYGQRARYKQGGALLARHSGAPIVPVAHNAGAFWPKGTFFKRPGTIDVVIGPRIHAQKRSAAEILAEAEDWIESTVSQLEPNRVSRTDVLPGGNDEQH